MKTSLAVLLVLSGCSITRTEESRIDGPKAEVSFAAARSGSRLTGGYTLVLLSKGRVAATRECDPDGEALIGDVEPGPYTVVITGRRLKRHEFDVRLKAGERTSIVVLHRNVLHAERAGEIALAAGKVIVYTVGIVVYGVVWLTVECMTHFLDDDPDPSSACSTCHQSPCCCHHPKRDPPARKGPRIRDWKKP